MGSLSFCPFISGACRSDCVFYSPVRLSLNNGSSSHCELSAFICCADSDAVEAVSSALKELHEES